jgi:hypothetical protein
MKTQKEYYLDCALCCGRHARRYAHKGKGCHLESHDDRWVLDARHHARLAAMYYHLAEKEAS